MFQSAVLLVTPALVIGPELEASCVDAELVRKGAKAETEDKVERARMVENFMVAYTINNNY